MELDLDAFLADLSRLAADDAPRKDAPAALRQFAVRSASALAPERVHLVPMAAGDSDAAVSPFVLPPLPSPLADAVALDAELEAARSPAQLLPPALQLPADPMATLLTTGSRFLAQLPMAPPRLELAPRRQRMVLHPLDLEYEAVPRARGAAPIEGFSEAMKSQQEYAKQNIGKQPFAPGGNALTDDGPAVSGSASLASPLELTPEDAAVLSMATGTGTGTGTRTVPEADELRRLEIRATGLQSCLTLDDLVAAESEEAVALQQREARADDDAVGRNPSSLLKPYLEMVGDREQLQAVRHSVAAERASLAMEQTSTELQGGVVVLDELLQDLEDDEELAAMGIRLDDSDEDAATTNDKHDAEPTGAETQIASATSPADADAAAAADDDDAMPLEPEAEADLLLAADTPVKKTAAASATTALSEYASIQRVDVRNFHEKVPDMAITYPFELDTFQKECVLHLERHECVFVAAHTSAGKTVVAEYAIAMSQRHLTRTIYTSPIKALSNQKYRDFRAKFGANNVGLITGDVSLNPEASCLVMTTEILRSMLYRGADVIRDIEWVIFDEIHYINDSERGVVWEEVIIMLPEHVGMVFLSATTPNHLEFSDWIGRTKKKKIHVISTYQRPVPLQHYLYAGKELFRLYDAANGYNASAYGAAKAKLFPPADAASKTRGGGAAGGRGGGRGGGSSASTSQRSFGSNTGDQSDWTKLIQHLKDQTLLPVVVFAFSKRVCEESAQKLSKLDLSTPSERSEIHVFLESSIQRLQGSDRELPQVVTMKEMLKRGIGVHHGGLLPILKEMVEILFARGLVKVLFSTETFAMGVNMPARTVVFNGIRKHDGKSFRDLLPGEYTQMAGRAGRRGLDAVGTVIIACWGDVPEPTSLQTMLAGRATSLSSQFRLTYNMILNLLRVEVLTVEDMMKRSFSEFHTQKALASKRVPQLLRRAQQLVTIMSKKLNDEYPHLAQSGELDEMREFYDLRKQKRELEKRLVQWLLTHHPAGARSAIAPGRLVRINVKGLPSDHAALVVRTSTVHDSSGGGGGSSSAAQPMADAGVASTTLQVATGARAQHLFKTITVVCLCPDDFEPPSTSSDGGSKAASGNASGGRSADPGRLLPMGKKCAFDSDDRMMMMMRRGNSGGKRGGSRSAFESAGGGEDEDGASLLSNTTETLLGRRIAVLDVPETCIEAVSTLMVGSAGAPQINVRNLVATASKKELAAVVELLTTLETADESKDGELLAASRLFVDVVHELKVHDLETVTTFNAWQQRDSAVRTHRCFLASLASSSSSSSSSSSTIRVLRKVETICKLEAYIAHLRLELSNDSLSLFPDFQQRLRVLKRLGYLSEDGVVQVKGRVACEINTCEEIVLTEMIFENVLAHLEPEEIVAVLSALIFQEKTQSEPTLTPRLTEAKETVQRIAESLGVIQLEQHLDIDPAVYCKGALNFGLMEVVYEWARGTSFKEICQLTDVQEGSIVRCITRLDEVCREVRNAARVIGDPSLFRKMEVASEAIKRDVVFASSLYLA
ncbi:hypothetical protein P43SY_005352 [Pythium insidiosum]|uniref:DEAD/DEAH box RNA helicase n=1 Tax=Pythium insidiosum TaxID=114742 RepID=A0AAD5Q9C7_PYTIN|nr:hypothetical protein P43SY_005352 [Pythium insidiosum]